MRGWKFVGFGDSITAGVNLQPEETYLHKLARRYGCPAVQAGVPGQTTAQALGRLPALIPDMRQAVVIVQFGMNDHVATAPDTPQVAPAAFADHLVRIGESVREAGGIPLYCTVHPILEGDDGQYYYARHPAAWYETPPGANKWIARYNEGIRAAALEQGERLADIAACWTQAVAEGTPLTDLLRTVANSGMDDGVHPTAAGHDLYAACIAEAIEPLRELWRRE